MQSGPIVSDQRITLRWLQTEERLDTCFDRAQIGRILVQDTPARTCTTLGEYVMRHKKRPSHRLEPGIPPEPAAWFTMGRIGLALFRTSQGEPVQEEVFALVGLLNSPVPDVPGVWTSPDFNERCVGND